jgi:type I restriction enzyme S subunit
MANENGKWPLPEGWVWTTIGDITAINQRDPALRDQLDELEVTFLPMAAVDEIQGRIAQPQIRRLAEVRKGFTSFKEGDVLFAKITPCMENGKAAIARGLHSGIGFGSTEFHVLRPQDGIIPEWVFYFVRQSAFREDAKANFSGTAGQLRVKKDFLETYPVPLAPLYDQYRIVAEIEKQFTRLDAAVAALQRAKANLARYKAAVLKAAVEGRLVAQDPHDEPATVLLERILAERRAQWEAANPKKRYVEPKRPEVAGLPELPEGWVWATVESLAAPKKNAISSGPFGSALGTRDYVPSGVPVIRGKNIRPLEFEMDEMVYVSEDKAQHLSRSLAYPEDLLVVAVGQSGQAALVPDSLPRSVLSQNVNKISFDKTLVLPKYVLIAMYNTHTQTQLVEKTTDTARKFLSLTNFRRTLIPYPPLDMQKRIVAEVERCLSVIKATENIISVNLALAERLRQGVLGKAFRGELV